MSGERILWECPACGMTLNLPIVTRRIVCSCDYDTAHHELSGLVVDENHYTRQRARVCEECREYLGEMRCKRIELGCRNAYVRRLHNEGGQCPVGNWNAVKLS